MSGWERPDRAACFGGSNCLLKSRSNLPVERSLLRWGLPHEPDETQRSKLRSTGGSRHGGDGVLPGRPHRRHGGSHRDRVEARRTLRHRPPCALMPHSPDRGASEAATSTTARPRHRKPQRSIASRPRFRQKHKEKARRKAGLFLMLEAAAVSRSQPLSGQISSGRSAPYDGSSRSCRPGTCSGSAPADGSRRSRSVQPDATRTHHCW